MSHQQDHATCIQVYQLDETKNGIHLGTTPISDKFQRSLKFAFERIINSLKYYHGIVTSGSGSIKAILEPQDLFLQRWYATFFFMSVISLALDPLFCYSLVINDAKKCLKVDKKLGTIAIVLRSVMDFLYVIHVIFEFLNGLSLPRVFGKGVKGAWALEKRDSFSYFLIDILSVLPLPQVALLIIIPQVKGTGFLNATNSLIFVVVFQYVPRLLRIYPLFKTFGRISGALIGSALAKAAFNLFLYMLASHVVGAFWYSFAVERKAICWQEACKSHVGCVRLSCDDILRDHTFLTDSCPIKTPNSTIFNFGIFLEALDSGIVDSTDFLQKFSYSFWFGLQSLSSLGQSLKTSTYFWEIFFAVIISIFGLVLFAFLIGNMQTYLQSKTARLEEMRLKGHDIDLWMSFHSLSSGLKERIKKYQQYKWQETRGVDVENLLHSLPRDIRRDIKRRLCLDVLKKVPMLHNMDDQLFDAICDHLKIVFYIKHSYVVREGAPLDEMLFITRGTLLTYTSNGGSSGFKNRKCLEKGDFYGEELLEWAVSYSPSLDNIPFSTKTAYTHTEVEAFALTANDLKNIVSKFMSRFRNTLCRSPSVELEQLINRAAAGLQEAWRGYKRKKLAASGREKLEGSGTTKASRFAANASSNIQGAQEASSAERIPVVPPMLPQQPADTIAEQQET